MQALAEYGYKLIDGVMVDPRRPSSQTWKPVPGGFLRFDRGVPMPHSLLPEFAKVSGLDYRLNPQCFKWLWPEPEVARIYIVAKEDEQARLREKLSSPPKPEEVITDEQLTAMAEAQEAAVPAEASVPVLAQASVPSVPVPEASVPVTPKKKWFGRN